MTTISLPGAIARYLAADSTHDLTAFIACFTPDAHVHDEAHDYRGHEQIRAWKEGTMKKFAYTVEPLKLTENSPVATLEAKVAGSHPIHLYAPGRSDSRASHSLAWVVRRQE